MRSNDQTLLAQLVSLRKTKGWSQKQLCRALGTTQGHLSKVLGRKVPISLKMRVKLKALLANRDLDETSEASLEHDLVAAIGSSSSFRALINAALDMYKYALARRSG